MAAAGDPGNWRRRSAMLGNLREHRLHYRRVYSEHGRNVLEILAFSLGDPPIRERRLHYAPEVQQVRTFNLGRRESPTFGGLKQGQPLNVSQFTVLEGSVEQVHVGEPRPLQARVPSERPRFEQGRIRRRVSAPCVVAPWLSR